MSELKPELLALSEEIVGISDRLDELDFNEDPQARAELHNRLLKIGDKLVARLDEAGTEDRAYIYFALGSLCSILGYWEKAEQAYDNALEVWPDHIGILNEAFEVLVELGKFEKALSYNRKSIKHGGETPDMLYNQASVTAHLGRLEEARIILINALAKFPADKGCRALLEELDLMKRNQNGGSAGKTQY